MPIDYSKTTTDGVYEFLKAAAEDYSFRKALETGTPRQVQRVLKRYGIAVDLADIPVKRYVPSHHLCRALIDQFGLRSSRIRARYDWTSSALAPFMIVIAYAMPLQATVRREVDAEG